MGSKYISLYLDFIDAKRSIIRKKFQSTLSAIGIIIGVISIIVMISIIEGSLQRSLKQIEDLGVNTIRIKHVDLTDASAKQKNLSSSLSKKDFRELTTIIKNAGLISPRYRINANVYYNSEDINVDLIGVNSSFRSIEKIQRISGRWMVDSDVANKNFVAFVSEDVLMSLMHGNQEGRLIVNKHVFQVVGVLANKDNLNNYIVIPYSSFEAVFPVEHYTSIDILSYDKSSLQDLYMKTKSILNKLHNGVGDYEIILPAEMLAREKETRKLYYILTTVIASMSLITGGVGIMNIMLANLAEKTREIGLRMAVGATPKRIVRIVIMESFLITFFAGTLGVLSGIIMVLILSMFSEVEIILSCKAIFVAITMTIFTGVFFGVYPGLKASSIEPMEALREYR